MSDLIDRSYIVQQAQDFRGVFKTDLEKYVADMFIRMVDHAPSVDAVPVVRCKDCKYWEIGKDYEPYCNHWGNMMADTVEDDFCSFGERKDNETD